MQFLRQSTAATLKIGPFVSSADGFTPMTALTITQADVRVAKNAGAFAQKNDATAATHDENGWYDVPVNTTDTNTLGRMRVAVYETGALPAWAEFMVMPANVWDALFGTDKLQVDLVSIDDQLTTGNNATLYLKQLNIVNNAGHALVAQATGSDGNGIYATGNGTGDGFHVQGGATGRGIHALGGATSGAGIYAAASTLGSGLSLLGAGASGHGLEAVASGTTGANGIRATSSAVGASAVVFTASGLGAAGCLVTGPSYGVYASASNVNGTGIVAIGNTTGPGIHAVGGATGSGLHAQGGSTSGNALHLTVTDGVKFASADITGTVTTDAGNSPTSFETDLPATTDDFYKDCWLKPTSGALKGQVKKIAGYNGTTKVITVHGGFTGTPADGVSFDIVNE